MKKRTVPMHLVALLVSLALILSAVGCSSGSTGGADGVYYIVPVYFDAAHSYGGERVQKVDFTDTTKTVTLTGLNGNNVFLVKANVSPSAAYGYGTGDVSGSSLDGLPLSLSARSVASVSTREFTSVVQNRTISGVFGGVTRYDFQTATEFNNRPPILAGMSARSAAAAPAATGGSVPVFSYSGTGQTKSFWVQNASGSWISIAATLRANGANCYVWVADSNYSTVPVERDNKIYSSQALNIASKFDAIYPVVTGVLGFEMGGGTGGIGGIDGDKKISILVYDISFDYAKTQTSNRGILGFFWSKDIYTQAQLNTFSSYKTNLAEMFYIDSDFTDFAPEVIYSTLIHEFQHMINYNRKVLIGGNDEVDTWYNEMLSLVAEDMFGLESSIDLASVGMPIAMRVPLFNALYDYSGVTDWLTGDDVLVSYSNAFAYGAYLARNYGGNDLIAAMEDSDEVGIASVSEALAAHNSGAGFTFTDGADETSAFKKAFRRYGEALIFSGSGTYAKNTFDRSVDDMPSFDIWDIINYEAGKNGVPSDYTGPFVWNLSQYNLAPYGLALQSSEAWQNVVGDLEITLEEPLDSDVELYLMVR